MTANDQVTLVVHDASVAAVDAARVRASGDSEVRAFHGARVDARDRARVTAHDRPRVLHLPQLSVVGADVQDAAGDLLLGGWAGTLEDLAAVLSVLGGLPGPSGLSSPRCRHRFRHRSRPVVHLPAANPGGHPDGSGRGAFRLAVRSRLAGTAAQGQVDAEGMQVPGELADARVVTAAGDAGDVPGGRPGCGRELGHAHPRRTASPRAARPGRADGRERARPAPRRCGTAANAASPPPPGRTSERARDRATTTGCSRGSSCPPCRRGRLRHCAPAGIGTGVSPGGWAGAGGGGTASGKRGPRDARVR